MTRILDQPVELRTGPDGRPAAFRWGRRWRRVAEVLEEWVYQEAWWERGEPPGRSPQRSFFRVRTEEGGVFELALGPGGAASVYRAFD
jgi:hypothetical protein